MTDYEKQGQDFLDKTGTKLTVKFNRQGKYFDGDKEERDIYAITLAKNGRSYTFEFGQSIAHSGRFVVYDNPSRGISPGKWDERQGRIIAPRDDYAMQKKWGKHKDFKEPRAYDILACLTNYDPGTLEQFCSEFGYDTDSKRANKTYQAVKDQYINLCRLYSDAELESMQEIS